MSPVEIIGWIAPVVFAIVFVPQAVKVFLSKKTKGISAISYSVIFFGSTLYMLWGGIAERTLPQLFVSEAIVSSIELFIIYYVFKNIGKSWMFYVALVWGIVMFVVGIVGWTNPSFRLNPVGTAPISVIGGLSIAFAFMPQTVTAILKRDVKNISIMTVVALATATSMLGTYQLLNDEVKNPSTIEMFEKIMGGSVEYLAAAWSVPQFILKVIDIRKVRKERAANEKEFDAIKGWAKGAKASPIKRAAILEWINGHGQADMESFDQLADRLELKHWDLDNEINKIVKKKSKYKY